LACIHYDLYISKALLSYMTEKCACLVRDPLQPLHLHVGNDPSRYSLSLLPCPHTTQEMPQSLALMSLCRPAPLAGALVLPNSRMLVSMLRIVRSLQPATLAILTCVKDLSSIISRIRSCCDLARLGAIVEGARRFKQLEGQYFDRHVRTAYVACSVGIAPELVGPLISYSINQEATARFFRPL
jgi:hypothetical protein